MASRSERTPQPPAPGRRMTKQEAWDLLVRFKTEKAARHLKESELMKLIEFHKPYVVSVARRYARDRDEMPDCVQDGIDGLIDAIARFNPNLGFKFLTYATWWIRKAIITGSRARNPAGGLYFPVYALERKRRIRKSIAELLKGKLPGEEITDEAIAKATKLKPQQVRKFRAAVGRAISLEEKIPGRSGKSARVEEILRQEMFPDPFDCALRDELRKKVRRALARLSPQEQYIFMSRVVHEKKLREVAFVLKLSRERVRQIQKDAAAKIKFYLRFTRHPLDQRAGRRP